MEEHRFKSQKILLALTQNGLSRQDAYVIVQSVAMQSWNSKKKFEDILNNNKEIKKLLSSKELKKILYSEDKVDNIDWIFKNKF